MNEKKDTIGFHWDVGWISVHNHDKRQFNKDFSLNNYWCKN